MLNKWQTFLDEIKNNVSEMAYNTYFIDTKFISNENNIVTFLVRNTFAQSTIEKKFYDKVINALKAAGFNCDDFVINVSSSQSATGVKRAIEVLPTQTSINTTTATITPPIINTGNNFKTTSNGLNPKYNLDNYVVGSNNDLAVSAARAVIEAPGERYNPYFLYGGSGYGKTHLIQAIGNELQKAHPEYKILYVTIEEFYHDFVTAMRKKVDGFQDKYRKLDVLIIDDFQFIKGKDASQDEFFHTFNELYGKGKQVIVASDRLPNEIEKMDMRLASRLTMGVAIDIQLPDFETRCAILKAKTDLLGETIDNETVEYLAENFNTNIRELEGALNRILLLADMNHTSTSDVISRMAPIAPINRHHISPKQLIDKVAKYYNLSSKDLLGKSRIKDIKNARQVAMYLMNEELGLSTVKIGSEFGKDHTTIMHGVKVVKNSLKNDFTLREQISELRGKIHVN